MPRTETSSSPGLVWRTRRNGTQVAYWCARKDLVRAGYRPSVVPLHGYAPGDEALEARCLVLQAEMLQWSVKRRDGKRVENFDGSFASLFRFYETHPDSPYHELLPDSRASYSKALGRLAKHKGSRLISAVDGSDVKRWHKELLEAYARGTAYFTINVLKAALSFGSSKRNKACRDLRQELRDVRFHAGERRTEYLTHQQVTKLCEEADRVGLPWLARCIRLQFDCGLRRRDVIGTYIAEVGEAGIRNRQGRVWRDGLQWSDIKDGVITRVVSKTRLTSAAVSVTTIADYPELAAELARTPERERIGPLVIHHRTGAPPQDFQCRAAFRPIARRVGVPDAVWQMDARAGAVTEAYEAGATEEETMALGQHVERDTSRSYLRKITEQSRRAAVKRVGSRSS